VVSACSEGCIKI